LLKHIKRRKKRVANGKTHAPTQLFLRTYLFGVCEI